MGDIAVSKLGKTLDSGRNKGNPYDYLCAINIKWGSFDLTTLKQILLEDEEKERYLVRKGDLLICEGGDVGRSAIWESNKEMYYQNAIHRVRFYGEISQYYFLHLLEHYKNVGIIDDVSKGVTIKHFTQNAMQKILFPIPPLAEQRRIVAEVEKWFALIDDLETNKQDLQSAVKQVRAKVLDLAIHGKLVPQDPNDEPAIALLRRINPHFTPSDTSHYQNPPFDIPASWQWVRVSDIAKTITGGTPSKNKPQYYGGTFPFYKPADLDAGRNVIVASEYLSEEGKSISRVIPPNSIAICCIGSIGKCGYLAKECTTNQQINTIVPYTNIFPLLIYYYCCSSFFKQQLVDKSSAITISIVNKSKLEDTLLPLPPLAEQKRIVSEIERIFGVLGTIEENIR